MSSSCCMSSLDEPPSTNCSSAATASDCTERSALWSGPTLRLKACWKRIQMESRAKLFGHPIHQMLIVFPLGLLATAVVFDVVWLVRGTTGWTASSYHMIIVGVISGLVAA